MTTRRVLIVFDSDAKFKSQVRAARVALTRQLVARGANPFEVEIPSLRGLAKAGIDDFLVRHRKKALDAYLMADFDRKSDREVDWVLGAVLMARREAIDKVGLLDDRFFLYFEDTDWCRRFWEAGYSVVYLAGAEMVHYHERLSARGPWFLSPFRESTRIHIASAAKYFAKWRDR